MTSSSQGVLRPDVGPDDHQAGSEAAPVTLVEYGDFECPHCFRAHPVVRALQKHFGEEMRFVFRNFPLTNAHEHALHAAEAAESVNANNGSDAYWHMHHQIFVHQQDDVDALDDAHLCAYAATAGADPLQVRRDLDGETYEERVKADFLSGVRSGVNGTPTFFINGRRFDGDWSDHREFEAAVARAAKTSANV